MICPDRSFKALNTQMRVSMETMKTAQTKQKIKQCRICLQSEIDPFKKMIAPCRCMGSIEYVHEDCLKQWIKSRLKSKPNWADKKGTQEIQCEMCKYRMQFFIQKKRNCKNCQEMAKIISQKKLIFILTIFMVIISAGGITLLIIYLGTQNQQETTIFEIVLGGCGIVVLCFFMFFSLATLLNDFMLELDLKIGDLRTASYHEIVAHNLSLQVINNQ